MSEHNAVVAIYKTHTEAEAAIKALKHAACNITQLSILGKDCHTDKHVMGSYNTNDRMKNWDKLGADQKILYVAQLHSLDSHTTEAAETGAAAD